jgi:hypothetical protein
MCTDILNSLNSDTVFDSDVLINSAYVLKNLNSNLLILCQLYGLLKGV